MTSALPLPVRQGTDAWLAMRRTGIGSSDAPIIAGEVGSVVELWAEKSGLVEPSEPDAPTAELFEWGHRLEPVIADWYADHEGRPLKRVNRMLRHPEIPWAFASLDRVSARKGERRIVEIKTTRWGWEAGESVPGRVQAQVQHQMFVTGYDVVDVAVLTGGNEPKIYEIPRDDTFIDNLRFLETEFYGWWQSGTRPPVDGSENARRVLSKLHPRNDGTLLPTSSDVDAVVRDWQQAVAAVKDAEAQADTLANTIRALIGDADGIEGPWGRVTWKKNADSKRTNWPAVASAYDRIIDRVHEWLLGNPEATETDVRAMLTDWASGAIESIHTATVEGPRVLRPSWKGSIE